MFINTGCNRITMLTLFFFNQTGNFSNDPRIKKDIDIWNKYVTIVGYYDNKFLIE